ncbi:DUF3110 domain-containing protein [Plectonema cf. radiosum LEGE 06105]|uniref:DUF3110 domain-containing protein n=1 Tax=Plectonema cf. radiosum LEGE 06105 TaxID=945769 RepID=A0A8J7JUL2_9CYAN|nr:DUF3110 domain-containing protein [Plectonema radiosum]MBE9213535.1 DUF3110 domain-containing protein [Plectonema cf. radiosum LEGE 06105]
MGRVFVLLFNARTENEGIHTVRIGDRNKVLMFESEDDATRFALMLEAQDFPSPAVEPMDRSEIERFCESADYDYELVPTDGDLVVPPEQNVDQTDWNEAGSTFSEPKAEEKGEMSNSELDNIRRKLEGLL